MKSKSLQTLIAVAGLALASLQLSCNVNDYCLNCATGDGGPGDDDGGNGDANDAQMDAPVDAACVPNGTEVCDGVDNDCNGLTDDGVLPQVDDPCDNQMGACSGGVKVCTGGQLKCSKSPSPEVCDNIDNNCNGTVDEGDPGGGAKCGTDMGECVAGTVRCQATAGCDTSASCDPLVSNNCCVKCTDFIDHRADQELCNGKDDDCDGSIDDNVPALGACTWSGATNTGACNIGTLECQGGNPVCVDAVFPQFETCNGSDDDCDSNTDEIFNKNTDPTNCGTCGNVCPAKTKTCAGGTNAKMDCTLDSQCPGSTCVINSQPCCGPNCGPTFPNNPNGTCKYKCNVGFVDLDNNAANGCEYKCSPTGNEVCDGEDNDCDGLVDDDDPSMQAAPQGLCLTAGECAGASATCGGANGWTCGYGPTVEFPEVSCDDLDNDCNNNVDDNPLHQAKGDACDDGQTGICRDTGTLACDKTNATTKKGPLVCGYTTNAPAPGTVAENCNAKDDDCDGNVDEGATLTGRDWIDIGGGKQMMKFEASRPDATVADVGINGTTVCSRSGVQPWTNVTYGQAVLACASVGATLCDEEQWHRACSVAPSTTYPVSVTTGTPVFIEAENYQAIQYNPTGSTEGNCTNATDDDGDGRINDGCVALGAAETHCNETTGNGVDDDGDGRVNDGCPGISANMHAWVEDYTAGFSGIAAMEATPNSGSSITLANAPTQAPRMDYTVDFTQTSSSYHIWVKAFSNGGNDNVFHVGLTGFTSVTLTTPSNGSWVWVDAGTFNVNATGTKTISVWMGKDGIKVDKIAVTTSATAPTDSIASKGNKWAFATNPNSYVGNETTCNGQDLSGSNDNIVGTGTLAACYADGSSTNDAFDMSGNVKEWTLAHLPGENPIRGGASNNTGEGISCPLNFTLADDDFFFPNIGFRCCR